MPKIDRLLSESEKLLKINPFDQGHDLSHHQRVWTNAQAISHHIIDKVNLDALHVACMWHDVIIGQKPRGLHSKHKNMQVTLDYLERLMIDQTLPEDFRWTVIEAIRHHEYSDRSRESVESKVLFDADKLDALDARRYHKLITAYKNKKMSKLRFMTYVRVGKIWLKTLRSKYYFAISQQLHDERLRAISQDPVAKAMALELNLDLTSLLE